MVRGRKGGRRGHEISRLRRALWSEEERVAEEGMREVG